MVKTSDVQKKSRGRGEDLQNEYIRELKLLRSMAHEVCDNFTLRREGNIETIISCLATVPRKKLRETLPEWLRGIRSLKLKPQKGRLKDLKEIDRVFVDNVYFYGPTPASVPTVAAPTPTVAAGNVISLFSDAYTNRTVDTWSAAWDAADLLDTTIAGNATKRYTNLDFAGIEFASSVIDATTMTHFHVDFWTPDPSAPPAAFNVQLVDFGANGVYDGGGDDSKATLTFFATSTPPLVTGNWVSLDIPLASFLGLTGRAHLALAQFQIGEGKFDRFADSFSQLSQAEVMLPFMNGAIDETQNSQCFPQNGQRQAQVTGLRRMNKMVAQQTGWWSDHLVQLTAP